MTIRRRALLAALPFWPAVAGAAEAVRLVMPVAAEPPGLIPGLSDAPATRLLGTKIYRGLVRIGPAARILPDLATLEVSEDSRRFTFRLQPGVTWHDGEPCTAADVVFSVARFHHILSPRVGPLLAGLEEAQATDPLTATLRFAQPFEAFPYLADALSLPIVPQHVHDRSYGPPDPMPWRPVGAGPFQLLAFGRLGRFVAYAGLPPALEEIAYPVADAAACLTLAQSGQLAMLAGDALDWAALPRLRQVATLVADGQAPPNLARLVSLAVNTARPPLDDPAVRQALSRAIDRAALLRDAWAGLGRVASGPLASISRFASVGGALPPYDAQAASLALTAAGLRPDDQGVRTRLQLLHPVAAPWPRMAARLAAMLRQVGVDLVAESLPPDAIAVRIAGGNYQLAAVETEQRADPTLDAASGFTDPTTVAATARAMTEAMARIWLVEPGIPVVRDRRLHIPGGPYGSFGDATLAG